MEFILEQQAVLAAHSVETKQRLDVLTILAEQHESDIQTHTEWMQALSAQMQSLTSSMQAGFEQSTASQNATDERLRATDERLNILIGVVERIIPRIPSY